MKGSGQMDFKVTNNITAAIPKIENGAKLTIGKERSITIFVDHHFNWLQKKMIKRYFGFNVEDYSE